MFPLSRELLVARVALVRVREGIEREPPGLGEPLERLDRANLDPLHRRRLGGEHHRRVEVIGLVALQPRREERFLGRRRALGQPPARAPGPALVHEAVDVGNRVRELVLA